MTIQELRAYLVRQYQETKKIQASAIGEGYTFEAGRADALSEIIHLLEEGK